MRAERATTYMYRNIPRKCTVWAMLAELELYTTRTRRRASCGRTRGAQAIAVLVRGEGPHRSDPQVNQRAAEPPSCCEGVAVFSTL